MRVAHFGTFDVENYGDLLFPLLARRRLAAIDAELVCVSPVGGPPVMGDAVSSVASGSLAEEPLDAVLLGGGNIVHAGLAGVDDYRQDPLTWVLGYAGLWIDSARIAAARGIPLCWNAPGVPQRFAPRIAPAVQAVCETATYLAVRDRFSLGNLRDAGVTREVAVAPDPAFDVVDLFDAGQLDAAFATVFAKRDRPRPERSLAIHLNSRYLDGDPASTARWLDRLARERGATLVLVALGRCHGDDETALAVAAQLTADHVVVDRPASLREVVAVLSRADGYVGSSLHGLVTALAFGRPGFVVAKERDALGGKFSGLLRQLRLPELLLPSWEAAASSTGVVGEAQLTWLRSSVRAELDDHWTRVSEAFRSSPPARGKLEVRRKLLLEHGVSLAASALAQQRAGAETLRRVQSELALGRRELEDLSAALARESAALVQERLAHEATTAAASEDRNGLQELQAQLAREAAERQRLGDEAAQLREQQRQEVERLQGELGASREAQAQAQRQVTTLQADLEAAMAAANDQVAGAQKELAGAREELAGAQTELAGAGNELAGTREELTDARSRLADAERESERLTRELDRVEAALRRASDEASAQARTSSERAARVERLEADLRELRNELVDRTRRLERATGELKGFHDSASRVAASRAWRVGHRLMRLARLLTFRRAKGAGAMPRLVGQAERALAALDPSTQGREVVPTVRFPRASGPSSNGDGSGAHPRGRAIPPGPPPTAEWILEHDSPAGLVPPRDTRQLLRGEPSTEVGSVDVVICVHDALPDVHRCLTSLLERSGRPLRLIVVDDGSDEDTVRYLQGFAEANPAVTLVRNADPPHGYTVAANIGIERSTADFVVLLNSDTVVTRGWLEQLVAAGMSDERVGIVGPLSNAASHQSVPHARDGDDWAVNELPDWLTEDGLALAVSKLPGEGVVCVPFLNGFCYCIRRRVIDAIGTFDAERFAAGYSEENDYSRRAAAAGFELVVATRAYVWHAKSRSYGHQDRRELAKRHYRVFLDRHGEERVRALVGQLQDNVSLAAVRFRVGTAIAEPARTVELLPRLSVTFVLPGLSKGGSGGSHSIYQEVSALRSVGLDARIAVPMSGLARAQEIYPDAAACFVPYADEAQLRSITADDDVVVATHYESVAAVQTITQARPACLAAYYVQDYEPLFAPSGSEQALRAERSYREIPGCLLFAKTEWLQRTLSERLELPVAKVVPSIDRDVFHARGRDPEREHVHVIAMIRPRTPRRAPAETLAVLARLVETHGDAIRVTTFGCEQDELERLGHVGAGFDHRGILSRHEVAELMRASDVFLDCSWYQAFGRTGLEAMACGATAVLPRIGGVDEFARDGENALLADTWDVEATAATLARVVEDRQLLRRLQAEAAATGARYSALRAALSEYTLFCFEHARRELGAAALSERAS